MLQRMNLRHDVKLDSLIETAKDVSRFFEREMPGTIYRTGAITEKEAVA